MNGHFLAIEVKGPNGKPSELQKYNIREIKKSMGIAIILYPEDWALFKQLVNHLINGEKIKAWKLCHQINEGRL